MKLIAGLGNPGEKYRGTRHNLGFVIVDSFARSRGLSWRYNQDWKGYFVKSGGFILLKPSTFMNRSGDAISRVIEYFKVDTSDVLVVHDDVDLPFGKVRLAFNGYSAGHHGVESVIENLGMEFGRLRVGIGSPRGATSEAGDPREAVKQKEKDVSDYVLGGFTAQEQQQLKNVIDKSSEAISAYLEEGIAATMNKFN